MVVDYVLRGLDYLVKVQEEKGVCAQYFRSVGSDIVCLTMRVMRSARFWS